MTLLNPDLTSEPDNDVEKTGRRPFHIRVSEQYFKEKDRASKRASKDEGGIPLSSPAERYVLTRGKSFGLSEEELAVIKARLTRAGVWSELLSDPQRIALVLGIFSVMWSEHCSYKSTRKYLKKLPISSSYVLQGPGENAGVIDIGDGDAVVFKMESHNHPSFIEPYQGAATGVGGIMRDVFTMGARPIAMLNALRFGTPEHPKTRHLVAGVVAGIGGYGNCMGVPTVGGEVNFHHSYNGNILVNAMCVGLAPADRIFKAAAKGAGNPVVYVGSKTGRDGIHGATMASAEFGEDSEEKRPTVQVGDPFTEKLLLEACLELMEKDAILAIQDMGAAGLTSSSVEMAWKGEAGIELNLDLVPQRELGMTPYEIMLSESQERMLVILKPGSEDLARSIFAKWELDFEVIGRTIVQKKLVLLWKGAVQAALNIDDIVNDPWYERAVKKRRKAGQSDVTYNAAKPISEALLTLLGTPDLCSRRWIWEQYDHSVMTNTVQVPGGDSAVVRVHGGKKGLALTTDVTPRYCRADPFEGAKQAVAEAWRNLTAVGALPLAITDNLNFGNPEHPEIMGEIVSSIDGIGEACRALSFPVVSGNCSLYNGTNGDAIFPTPAIGGVGLLGNVERMATIAFKRQGDSIILVGETKGHLGQSIYLREIEKGREEGSPPPVDLAAEKRNGDFVRSLIENGRTDTVHDLSDGGLLVAIAEMAMADGMGLRLTMADAGIAELYGEDQARYVIAVPEPQAAAVLTQAKDANVPARIIGSTGGDELVLNGQSIAVAALRSAHESWFPKYMGAGLV